MIVGTAGHIDHGKTTLVRALTGVDTDRLPEEKQRGITIELGYAYVDGPDGRRIGFVDVPGHERLVHTMLAGASGIDFALLLVAADDGVMPQTREHLAVLSLLGLSRGAVAVTKCDRVDAARVQAVAADVAALLAPTPLAGAPVLPVSAVSGVGVAALSKLLADAARDDAAVAADRSAFRVAVDRSFTLDGVGTVVTGSAHAGRVDVGAELRVVPGERRVRVRSLHAQDRPVTQARAGQRCALSLAGVDRHAVERGQWLVTPAFAVATSRIDVDLVLWHEETRPLRSGTTVFVHLGASAELASVAVLDPDAIEAGASGRVQLVLRRPIGAWHGDRVVLRDASATRTIAGGRVLDPHAPTRYRRTPQRLAELDALTRPDAAQRLAALLAVAPNGVDLRRFAAAQGEAAEVPDTALRAAESQTDHALGAAQTERAAQHVLALLAQFHAGHPQELGPDAARLRRLALPRLPEPLWRALLARLQADGRVQVRGAWVHLPEHGVQLSAVDERLAQKAGPQLANAGFEGAWVRDLARDLGENEMLLRATMARLAQRGEVHQVVKDLYYAPATIAKATAIARDLATAGNGEVSAADFRDATGLGRKRAIQILEYFDRIGLLRRVGDVHRLRSDSRLYADDAR